MSCRLLVRSAVFLLLAPLQLSPDAAAQEAWAPPDLWVHGGVAPNGEPVAALGVEFRGDLRARVTPIAALNMQWSSGACDAIAGAFCDEDGLGASVGGLVSLTGLEGGWRVYTAPRAGVFFWNGLDRAVFNPSLALGLQSGGRKPVGFGSEARYSVLTRFSEGRAVNSPRTGDSFYVLLGFTVALQRR